MAHNHHLASSILVPATNSERAPVIQWQNARLSSGEQEFNSPQERQWRTGRTVRHGVANSTG